MDVLETNVISFSNNIPPEISYVEVNNLNDSKPPIGKRFFKTMSYGDYLSKYGEK